MFWGEFSLATTPLTKKLSAIVWIGEQRLLWYSRLCRREERDYPNMCPLLLRGFYSHTHTNTNTHARMQTHTHTRTLTSVSQYSMPTIWLYSHREHYRNSQSVCQATAMLWAAHLCESLSLGAIDRPLGPAGTQGPICSTECVILSQQACHSSNHSNTHSFLEFWILQASEDHQEPVYLFSFGVGLSLWFTDTGVNIAPEGIPLFLSRIFFFFFFFFKTSTSIATTGASSCAKNRHTSDANTFCALTLA